MMSATTEIALPLCRMPPPCSTLVRGRAAQVQPLAKVYTVGVLCDERGAQAIQPLQGLLAQRIHEKDVLNIEDTLGSWTELASNSQEFLHPLSRQSTLKNEHRSIFARRSRDS